MSIITELGENFENFQTIMARYEAEFKQISSHLKMKGLPLDQMLIEQASWVGHYEIRQAELKTLRKYVESQIDRVKGKLWKKYTETYPRELNYRDKEHYVNFDDHVCTLKEIFHDVTEMEEKYGAACDALQQKGFMLNALVKAKTGGFDTIVL